MKIQELVQEFNKYAPFSIQENYDNSGLNVGFPDAQIESVLLCIDVTLEVVEEAIVNKCNLIISHHPLIFSGIKTIVGKTYIEKAIIKAIKHDISIFCVHTNIDLVYSGVSKILCEKLRFTNLKILSPRQDLLKKLVVFVPESHSESIKSAIFSAGAGHIGNYDSCSFTTQGIGSFKANEQANPYVGRQNVQHEEKESRIEVIYPYFKEAEIIKALVASHPYEEPAFDLYNLSNTYDKVGYGMSATFDAKLTELDFLAYIKKELKINYLKHSPLIGKQIEKVAVCGGSGSFLIKEAIRNQADAFITADLKYHDYFLAENKILLIDIGHYESEVYVKEIFYDVITKINPNFAVIFSKINTNQINTF